MRYKEIIIKGVNSHGVGLLVGGNGTNTDIHSRNVMEGKLFKHYICFTQTYVQHLYRLSFSVSPFSLFSLV